jgi:hypothetical protein
VSAATQCSLTLHLNDNVSGTLISSTRFRGLVSHIKKSLAQFTIDICTSTRVQTVRGSASDSVAAFDSGDRKPSSTVLLAGKPGLNMMLHGRASYAGQRPSSSSRDRPLQQHLCQLPVYRPVRASRRAVKRQSNSNGNLHGHGLGPSASTWEGLNQALADEFLQAIKAPQVSEPKVFVFVRHGHSTWNQQSRIQVSRHHSAKFLCCS